ncbi:MAG: PaaI family thioesterase [Gorillibacterium sp.]|nr:PaaI family thioesterase [Gorillibacterium sp.]
MGHDKLFERINKLTERDVRVLEQTVSALEGMKDNKYPFLGNFLQIVREECEEPERFLCSMPIRPDLLNPYRIVYGGITATLADMAMGWMLETRIEGRDKFVTIDMHVNYHNPGVGKKLFATAWVTNKPKEIWQAACEIRNDRGSLVATSSATFLQLVRKTPALAPAPAPAPE